MATQIQIHRAWQIARAHGHHWAAPADEWHLEWARRLLEICPEFDRWSGHNYRHLVAQATDGLGDEVYYSNGVGYDEGTPDAPAPTTVEQCELLSILPTCTGSGIAWSLDDDGVHRSGTGTGRCDWDVYPDGTVEIRVTRPVPDRPYGSREGYVVLQARVDPDGQWVAEHVAGVYRYDHVEALGGALLALVPDADLSALYERIEALDAADQAIAADESWRDRAEYETEPSTRPGQSADPPREAPPRPQLPTRSRARGGAEA